MKVRKDQTLLIDADDTLWQNNIYFEQSIEAFIDYLDHSSLSRSEIRAVLDEIETANSASHGYGSAGFTKNLRQCFEHLVEREIDDGELATVMGFGQQILSQDIVLLDGVADTLRELSMRHELVMFTKGHAEEQQMKIDRSGLDVHFVETIIVPEKDAASYELVMSSRACDVGDSWMIGNSPKSDINPALAIGMNAVFIPHDHTWSLEQKRIEPGRGQLLELTAFSELLNHF